METSTREFQEKSMERMREFLRPVTTKVFDPPRSIPFTSEQVAAVISFAEAEGYGGEVRWYVPRGIPLFRMVGMLEGVSPNWQREDYYRALKDCSTTGGWSLWFPGICKESLGQTDSDHVKLRDALSQKWQVNVTFGSLADQYYLLRYYEWRTQQKVLIPPMGIRTSTRMLGNLACLHAHPEHGLVVEQWNGRMPFNNLGFIPLGR